MLKVYFDLLRLKGDAGNIPYRLWVPFMWVGLDVLIVVLASVYMGGDTLRHVAVELIDVAYTVVILFALLAYYQLLPRLIQAASAVLGVNTILFSLLMGLMLVIPNEYVIIVLMQVVYIWFLIVFVEILRQALNISIVKALLWLFAIEAIRVMVLGQILRMVG